MTKTSTKIFALFYLIIFLVGGSLQASAGAIRHNMVNAVRTAAPTVVSIARNDATPTKATTVSFTVTFSEAVTGVDGSDFTTQTLSGSVSANIGGVSGSGSTYTVNVIGVSGNGTFRLNLNASGTGIENGSAEAIAAGFTGGDIYTIDNTIPTLTSGSYFSNNGYSSQYAKVGDNITLSVGYNEVLQSMVMTIGGNSVSVTPSNGNRNWTGVLTTTSSDNEGNVPWTLAATDLAGNVRNYTNNDFGTFLSFDKTAPVASISAPSRPIIGTGLAGTVTYDINYVDNNFNFSSLSAGDITLNKTGDANGSINVSGSGNHYTVTISDITGVGTLGITIGAGTGQDIPGNIAAASDPSATFTVSNIHPTATVVRAGNSSTNSTSVGFTVTFSEPVTGVDAADFALVKTGAANGTLGDVTGSGTTYTVSVTDVSGNGTIGLNLNATGTGITNSADNELNTGTTGEVYTIDTTIPTLTSGSYFSNNGVSSQYTKVGDDITLTIGYNEPLQSLVMTIGGNAITVSPSNGNRNWTGVLTTTTSDTEGNVQWTLAATDLAGNVRNYTNNDFGTFLIFDKTAPVPTFDAPSQALIGGGTSGTVTYALNYVDANFNYSTLAESDLSLNTTGTATGSISLSGSGSNYIVTISNITGLGTLGVTVAAEKGVDIPGNLATGGISTTFAVVSTDATLSNLTTSAGSGALAPGFTPGNTSYTKSVPNSLTTITVTPTVNEASATVEVRVNGGSYTSVTSGNASTPLALNVGSNTLDVTVTAADGVATKTYTIMIERGPSANASLATLKYDPFIGQTLVPGSNYRDYVATVKRTVDQVSITPTVSDPGATIKVNGVTVVSGMASDPIPLVMGPNVITTVVTAGNGTSSKTYSITITRALSSDNNLASLTMAPGKFKPNFAAVKTNYTAVVTNDITEVKLTPTVADANATVKVNGSAALSGMESDAIALNTGDNIIPVEVTAEDGSVKTYTVTVTRQISTDARLLTLTYTPDISQKMTIAGTNYRDYTAIVKQSVSSVTVTPVSNNAASTITVNGVAVVSGMASAPIALDMGANVITTIVTAGDGLTSKTYQMTLTRVLSPDNNLAGLSIDQFNIKPNFAASKITYTATAPTTTASIRVKPTTADETATVKVNGVIVTSGDYSDPISLNVGNNDILTEVTAQDGTTKTYTIAVNRLASTNAQLLSLTYNPVVNQILVSGSNYRDYTASVANSVTEVSVTPTVADATAKVAVNGEPTASGSATAPIALSAGTNTINTVVTAQDGSTKTYSIVITRQGVAPDMTARRIAQVVANDIIVHQNVSPNGDGRGDGLTIEGINNYPDNKLQIMNRSGNLVYEAKGYDNNSKVFDGHSSTDGRLQQPGTYFYSLEYKADGKTQRKTGFVVLKY